MKLIVDLKKISQENYLECINYIITQLKEKDYLVSISQFGSIKFPGISDIDLIIVIKNDCDYFFVKNEIDSIILKSPYSSICFWHEALVIKKEDLKYLNFFHTTENLNILYGEIIIKDTSIDSRVQLYKWNAFFYRLFLYFKNTEKVSMRLFLLGINNLATCLKYNNSKNYLEFKNKVDKLRSYALNDKNIEKESQKILDLGLEEIRYIEKINCKSETNFKFLIQKRNIYIFINSKLDLIDMKIFKIYLYPLRYYYYYKEYRKEVKKITWYSGTYESIRKRFTSPDFFGF